MERVWHQSSMTFPANPDDFIDELLQARGIQDPDSFLAVTKKKLHNPYKMKDMKPAVARIIQAIQQNEVIGIYGDFDADGVSSTSTWVLTLRDLNATVHYFIPDRFKDGYGLHKRGIDYLRNQGCTLLITCDTGITAIGQTEYAKSIGFDVIITDHHEPQQAQAYDDALLAVGKKVDEYLIPNCTAVVNIKRPDCKYPFKGLAGVGVSFKILCAVCDKLHLEKRKGAYHYLDLVALGTLADMMEIVDENRVITALGLRLMSKTKNRGLYQLLRANDLKGKQLTSMDIGWTIAPCINAAGRIVSAEEAVEMVISDNKLDAFRSAKALVEINKQRKELTKTYVDAIIKSVEAEQQKHSASIVVAYYPDIPEGIVGLIAGRMMNHFHKPVLLLTDAESKDRIKGSGRSIPNFNLFETLMMYTDILHSFGGHHAACGLSLSKSDFAQFKHSIEFYADSVINPSDLTPSLKIDCTVKGENVNLDLVHTIRKLEPFGNGNPKPLFIMKNLNIFKCKPVGEEQNHFWALLSDGKRTFSTIGFFLWARYEEIGKPKRIDVAFFPDENEYQGKVNVQLKLEDLRKAGRK